MRVSERRRIHTESAVKRVRPLLHSVLIEPAEAFSEVPAQCDGENVDESEQSERVEQNHRVLQEG